MFGFLKKKKPENQFIAPLNLDDSPYEREGAASLAGRRYSTLTSAVTATRIQR